jgi:hypothetical protein
LWQHASACHHTSRVNTVAPRQDGTTERARDKGERTSGHAAFHAKRCIERAVDWGMVPLHPFLMTPQTTLGRIHFEVELQTARPPSEPVGCALPIGPTHLPSKQRAPLSFTSFRSEVRTPKRTLHDEGHLANSADLWSPLCLVWWGGWTGCSYLHCPPPKLRAPERWADPGAAHRAYPYLQRHSSWRYLQPWTTA